MIFTMKTTTVIVLKFLVVLENKVCKNNTNFSEVFRYRLVTEHKSKYIYYMCGIFKTKDTPNTSIIFH